MSATTEQLVKAKSLASDPAWLFQELMRRLEKCTDPEVEKRCLYHLHQKAGYQSLRAFNLAGHKPQRVEIFTQLLIAVINSDFSKLIGAPHATPEQQDPTCDVDVQIEDHGQVLSSPLGERDTALSKLIELLTKPGITAQVKVWVTIVDPPVKNDPTKTIDDAKAFSGDSE